MRTDIVYLYDGTFEGLLTCVFECYEKKEDPAGIQPEEQAQMMLFPTRIIETDSGKAARVETGIRKKASGDAFAQVLLCFYSCRPEKELLILRFVRLCMNIGKKTMFLLTDDTVNELNNAVKALTREAHQYKGFVRFSEYDGVLAAVIEPKNYVLPLLAEHFADRYPGERFMIFDKAHGAALFYQAFSYDIFPVEDFKEPEPGKEERDIRALWKLFYDTIAIKERENPRCRMTHMQKRYWNHLTEMKETAQKDQTQAQTTRELPLS